MKSSIHCDLVANSKEQDVEDRDLRSAQVTARREECERAAAEKEREREAERKQVAAHAECLSQRRLRQRQAMLTRAPRRQLRRTESSIVGGQ